MNRSNVKWLTYDCDWGTQKSKPVSVKYAMEMGMDFAGDRARIVLGDFDPFRAHECTKPKLPVLSLG